MKKLDIAAYFRPFARLRLKPGRECHLHVESGLGDIVVTIDQDALRDWAIKALDRPDCTKRAGPFRITLYNVDGGRRGTEPLRPEGTPG